MGSSRQRLLLGLILGATVAAGVAHYAGAPAVLSFVMSGLALAGLAWVVSAATEAVGQRFGPAITGVLQSSLGNLPELFVVLFALRAGQVVVAETSILGSIFANALLVMGLVILAGVRVAPDDTMRFQRRLPQDTATLLLLAVFIIVLLSLSVGAADPASGHRQAISNIGAVLLIAVYGIWLIGYLRGDMPAQVAAAESGETGFTFSVAADASGRRRRGCGIRLRLVRDGARSVPHDPASIRGLRGHRDRSDRRQRGGERRRHRPGLEGEERPRRLGG